MSLFKDLSTPVWQIKEEELIAGVVWKIQYCILTVELEVLKSWLNSYHSLFSYTSWTIPLIPLWEKARLECRHLPIRLPFLKTTQKEAQTVSKHILQGTVHVRGKFSLLFIQKQMNRPGVGSRHHFPRSQLLKVWVTALRRSGVHCSLGSEHTICTLGTVPTCRPLSEQLRLKTIASGCNVFTVPSWFSAFIETVV